MSAIMKQVLDKLSEHDMHVHAIEPGLLTDAFLTGLDTHFVMQGSNRVHIGNVTTITRFSLGLAIKHDPPHQPKG